MSKNGIKNKERLNEESKDNKYEDNDIFNYENQFIKTTQIGKDTNNDNLYEEQGIKINLSKIEERPTDEEESCISSIAFIGEKRLNRKDECLKKLLKYRNKLYYYFYRWKKIINNSSAKKRLKKIKKKKKRINTKYNLGDNFIINEEASLEDENKSKKKLYHSMILNSNSPNKKRIKNNLKYLIENCNKKYFKNFFIRWKKYTNKNKNKKEEKPSKSEKKYTKNIFEDNDIEIKNFCDFNNSGAIKRKELVVKKNENIIPDSGREIKKSFRISQSNHNIFFKFEENEKDLKNIINNVKRNKSLNKKGNILEINKSKDNEHNNHKTSRKKSKKMDKSEDKIEKRKGHKKKKNKKIKLKKIIEKINDHKLLCYCFNKWKTNHEIKTHNYYDLITKKIEDILFEDEKNNNLKGKNSPNQEEVVIPLYLANNNYFNGNYNFEKINPEIFLNKAKTISDDNENNDSEDSEEEIIFKHKIFKRIKNKDRKDNNENKRNFTIKKKIDDIIDKDNKEKNKDNNNNISDRDKKDDINITKNNSYKNKKMNILIKENEVPKIIKKRSNNNENQNNFSSNNIPRRNNNYINNLKDNNIENDNNKDNNVQLIFKSN